MANSPWTSMLAVGLAASFAGSSLADVPAAGKVLNVGKSGNEEYETVQEALDAAPPGSIILIAAGRFDERLKVTKPVRLVGAGSEKTILGPTAAQRDAMEQRLHAIAQGFEEHSRALEAAPDPLERKEIEARAAQMFALAKALQADYYGSILSIENVRAVDIQALRVTAPGTPRQGSGLAVTAAIDVQASDVRLANCVVVGCLGNGVRGKDGANIEIEDSLVAACWDAGVTSSGPGSLTILNSDVRNCYHHNVWTGADPCTIRDCRISGSAWFGVRFGGQQTTIVHNAIFENARAGVYAEGVGGRIEGNLIHKNGAGGASCFWNNKSLIEGNLFLDNVGVNIYVMGACEPTIRRNVFVGGDLGALYGSLDATKKSYPPTGNRFFIENLLWGVAELVAVQSSQGDTGQHERTVVELPAELGNRVQDPQVVVTPRGRVKITADSPLNQMSELSGVASIDLQSRWPLTEHERAMIPANGSRDWSNWKMKPR